MIVGQHLWQTMLVSTLTFDANTAGDQSNKPTTTGAIDLCFHCESAMLLSQIVSGFYWSSLSLLSVHAGTITSHSLLVAGVSCLSLHANRGTNDLGRSLCSASISICE